MSVVASSNALVDIDEALVYLRLRTSDDNDLIQTLINAVSNDCQIRFCKRNFLKQTYTDEKYDGDGTGLLMLRQWPIVSVSSLVIQDGGSELTEDTNFFVYPDEGIIKLYGLVMPKSYQKVVVTYDAGYDGIPNIPAELKLAICKGVAWKYKLATGWADGVINQGLEGQTAAYLNQEYPTDVLEIFNSYRRKTVHGI